MINEAKITYFGQSVKVKCDRNCGKAWGIAVQPYKQLSNDQGKVGARPSTPTPGAVRRTHSPSGIIKRPAL